jgi:hypothetical protein
MDMMTAPEVIEAGEATAITVIFHKRLQDWSEDDRKVIVRRLRDYMRDQCKGKKKAVKRTRRHGHDD